jgi:chromosome condensin MukBEF complex kleisin-like MukF subunit
MADCIRDWRFQVSPPELLLDEDIAQLETRMAEMRPAGLQFSQAEILRAYAVQLHLKQIARMLQASRVEISRIVAEAQK